MSGSLNRIQTRHFEQEGYLFPLPALSASEARACLAKLEEYEAALGEEPQKYLKIKAHLAGPWMVDLARHPAILDAVESLLGPNILLFGASLFSKNAHDTRFVSWHQDSAYYGLEPHEEVTVWVAFTPSNEGNGCLRVMPRSHLGPDLEHDETYDPKNMLARGQSIRGLAEDRAVSVTLRPGEFSIHHERTAHGSLPNRSAGKRVGLAFFYIPTHVRSVIGRRSASLVRGTDDHGHWDPAPLPERDLDPACMARLKATWAKYQDREVRQAASSKT